MATHCSILAWRIPWTEEPGRLQSWGLQSQMGLSNWARTRQCMSEFSCGGDTPEHDSYENWPLPCAWYWSRLYICYSVLWFSYQPCDIDPVIAPWFTDEEAGAAPCPGSRGGWGLESGQGRTRHSELPASFLDVAVTRPIAGQDF